jgi:hypothetical protein
MVEENSPSTPLEFKLDSQIKFSPVKATSKGAPSVTAPKVQSKLPKNWEETKEVDSSKRGKKRARDEVEGLMEMDKETATKKSTFEVEAIKKGSLFMVNVGESLGCDKIASFDMVSHFLFSSNKYRPGRYLTFI